jgi:hypothetical protein
VIYTCGRMHKQRKQKFTASKAKTVITAVSKVMLEELTSTAYERWCSRLNTELGCGTFLQSGGTLEGQPTPVPRVWVPSKPKIALALLDEFDRAHDDPAHDDPATDNVLPKATIGSKGAISKLLARHAVERLRRNNGPEWLQACGELSTAQLDDSDKMKHTLCRVAFDLLVYLHARATELVQHDTDVVLELHSSDQTLMGKSMRGCGVVYCEVGRLIFARATAVVREALRAHLPPPR